MNTYEITGRTPYDHGMKASPVSYGWNFRESRWVDMSAYRGDGTGMSVASRSEAESHLQPAIDLAEGLEAVRIVECWDED